MLVHDCSVENGIQLHYAFAEANANNDATKRQTALPVKREASIVLSRTNPGTTKCGVSLRTMPGNRHTKSDSCGSIKCHIVIFFLLTFLALIFILAAMVIFNPFRINCATAAGARIDNCTTDVHVDEITKGQSQNNSYSVQEIDEILRAMQKNAALFAATVPLMNSTISTLSMLKVHPARRWKLRQNVAYDDEPAAIQTVLAPLVQSYVWTSEESTEHDVMEEEMWKSSVERFKVLEERVDDGGEPSHHFDAREAWPSCPQIFHVYDQAGCGSCCCSVAAIADRTCIASLRSGRQFTSRLSAVDATRCGNQSDKNICLYGGTSEAVYWNWIQNGLETEDCLPYPMKSNCGSPCGADSYVAVENIDAMTKSTDVKCGREAKPNQCQSESEKAKGLDAYEMPHVDGITVAAGQAMIKLDVEERGPGTICIVVPLDFLYYAGGIYKHIVGDYLYGHCMKLIGWGEENDTSYWIVSNTWGIAWGEDGFGRIDMNDVMINENFRYIAGQPDIE